MSSAKYHPLTDTWALWFQRRRVLLLSLTLLVAAVVFALQHSEESWKDHLQTVGSKIASARQARRAGPVDSDPQPPSERPPDPQMLAEFEAQLEAGRQEREKVQERLKKAEAALAAVKTATSGDQDALQAAQQEAKTAQQKADKLTKQLAKAKAEYGAAKASSGNSTDADTEAAALRKSLAKAQEKLGAVQEQLEQQKQQPRSGPAESEAKVGVPGLAASETGGAYYHQYIDQDLKPWAEHGITKDLVDEVASGKYEKCWYDKLTFEHSGFRFQIINGTLWVDHLPWHNYEGGVVSHALTPDPYNIMKKWTSAGKARVPLMILGLLDVLRAYPGQIPDLDAVLSVADFPCVPAKEEGRDKPPAIMMSYGAKPGMVSVLVPDHTHWGNEGGLLARVSDGKGITGWEAQHQHLKIAAHERFLDKRNYAYWVGRVQFREEGERDWQRWQLVRCGQRLRELGDPRGGYISINGGGTDSMTAYCKHRYLPYLESHAYSSKYKQLLACGSVMIAPRIDYPDFFLRALQKGVHYVEVDSDNLCNDMVDKLQEMDDAVWSDANRELNLTAIVEPIFYKKRDRKTLRGPRFLDALEHGASIPNEPRPKNKAAGKGKVHSWGSHLMPWEIAWNGQLWLDEHLTMQDVREGFRDALIKYGNLMKYKPEPTKGAYCYDGPLALRQFGPDPNDAADVLETYPWMLDYGIEACAEHITGWEKWPGFPNMPSWELEKIAKAVVKKGNSQDTSAQNSASDSASSSDDSSANDTSTRATSSNGSSADESSSDGGSRDSATDGAAAGTAVQSSSDVNNTSNSKSSTGSGQAQAAGGATAGSESASTGGGFAEPQT